MLAELGKARRVATDGSLVEVGASLGGHAGREIIATTRTRRHEHEAAG